MRYRKHAPDLFGILSIEQEQLTDNCVSGEIVNLAPKENDSLAKEQAEGGQLLLDGAQQVRPHGLTTSRLADVSLRFDHAIA